MSDTSIGSAYSFQQELSSDYHQQTGSCWTRGGANACVGILALFVILLAVIAGLLAYDRYTVQKVFAKNKKLTPKTGLFSFIGGVINTITGISDSGSGSGSNNGDADGDDDDADDASAENDDPYETDR